MGAGPALAGHAEAIFSSRVADGKTEARVQSESSRATIRHLRISRVCRDRHRGVQRSAALRFLLSAMTFCSRSCGISS